MSYKVSELSWIFFCNSVDSLLACCLPGCYFQRFSLDVSNYSVFFFFEGFSSKKNPKKRQIASSFKPCKLCASSSVRITLENLIGYSLLCDLLTLFRTWKKTCESRSITGVWPDNAGAEIKLYKTVISLHYCSGSFKWQVAAIKAGRGFWQRQINYRVAGWCAVETNWKRSSLNWQTNSSGGSKCRSAWSTQAVRKVHRRMKRWRVAPAKSDLVQSATPISRVLRWCIVIQGSLTPI